MKVPFFAKVLVVNVVLILLAYLVYQDLAGRNAYAGALNFAPSTTYSILTHSLTLSGRATVLTSPPTLDWFQLLVLIAAATDAYMFWGYFKRSPVPEQPSLSAAETAPASVKAFSKTSSIFAARVKGQLATPAATPAAKTKATAEAKNVRRPLNGAHTKPP